MQKASPAVKQAKTRIDTSKVQHGDFYMWFITSTLPAAGEQLFAAGL